MFDKIIQAKTPSQQLLGNNNFHLHILSKVVIKTLPKSRALINNI